MCPGFLEAAVWRKLAFTNVRHHLMTAYMKVGSVAWLVAPEVATPELPADSSRNNESAL